MRSVRRVLLWAFTIGGISFALGFFGPIILAPGANQGPLLGILITGPLGLLAGLILGFVRELLGYQSGPLQVLARTGVADFRIARSPDLWRALAALAGGVLAIYVMAEARLGVTRGVAAAVILCVALLYFAATGRVPSWFRR